MHVDVVVPNVGDENSGVAISAVAPRMIAVGDDWKGKDYLGQLGITSAWLNDIGAEIAYLPYTDGISTTEIIARIAP